MLIIPIGHDQSLRRFPYLTAALIACCTLLQLRACVAPVDESEVADLRTAQQREEQAWLPEALLGPIGKQLGPGAIAAIPGVGMVAALAPANHGAPHAPANPTDNPNNQDDPAANSDHDDPDDSDNADDDARAARAKDSPRPDPAMAAEALDKLRHVRPREVDEKIAQFRAGTGVAPDDPRRLRWLALQTQIDALLHKDPAFRYGYRPSEGPSINMLLYAFFHGGVLHLLGNMLFLWLVGCNLEDRWGKPAFGLFMALGAIAAAFSYRLWHPGSDTVLIGASGAIAAAMAAFAINYYEVEIRFFVFFFFPPRFGTFEAKAMFVVPFWFLSDLASAWFFESHHATAYSAHVGGFIAGAAMALALKYSGIEKKKLLPASAKGVEWEEHPELIKALDLIETGAHADAVALLKNVLVEKPRHATAAVWLLRCGVALGDRALVEANLPAAITALGRDGQQTEISELARQIEGKWRMLAWPESTLSAVARAHENAGHLDFAEQAWRKLLRDFPDSAQEVRARNALSDLLERTGRYSEAREQANTVLSEQPDHPLAPVARDRLARLEGKVDQLSTTVIAKNAIAEGGISLDDAATPTFAASNDGRRGVSPTIHREREIEIDLDDSAAPLELELGPRR